MRTSDAPSLGLILRVIFLTIYFAFQSALKNIVLCAFRWASRGIYWLQLSVCHLCQNTGLFLHRKLSKRPPFPFTPTELSAYPAGTVGYEWANWLRVHGFKPVKCYETHDLQHVLLGYPPTLVGEYELQAFRVGNRQRSLLSYAAVALAFLTCPQAWVPMLRAYRRGRCTTQNVAHLAYSEIVGKSLRSIQAQLNG